MIAEPVRAPDLGSPDLGPGEQTDRRWRLRHLPLPLAASGVVAVLAAVAGGLVAGAAGAAGAGAGVVLVAVGYLLSTLVIAWADAVAPALVMPVGLMAYLVKIAVVGGVMMVIAVAEWPGLVPMAWGIVAGVLGWTASHIWWLTRRSGTR